MPVKFAFDNPLLRAWLLLHQTYNLILKSEDAVFAKVGLTTQQHGVLMAIKYIQDPVTPTDVSNWLDRNPNGISMLLYRMEKDGLVSRVRDLRDRRSVRLVITERGNEIFGQATIIGWQLVEKMLSDLPEEDLWTLISLLEKVREQGFKNLNLGEAMEEIKIKNEAQNIARFLAKMSIYADTGYSGDERN